VAVVEITPVELDEDGLVRDEDSDSFEAANSDGNEYVNDGRTIFEIRNEGSTEITATFTAQKTSIKVEGFGQSIPISDKTLVTDGSTGNRTEAAIILPTAGYNDGNGKVQVTYSAVTDLKVRAVKIANVG